MKIPRDVDGKKIVKLLIRLGYKVENRRGSHTKLKRINHSISIPEHKPLKIGTLSNILKDISHNNDISMDDIVNML